MTHTSKTPGFSMHASSQSADPLHSSGACSLRILNLYPHQMTGMGDAGNLLVLLRRLAWRNMEAELISFEPGSDAAILGASALAWELK